MYRDQIHSADRSHVFHLLSHCGQLSRQEIAFAMSLFDATLHKEQDERYHFVLQEKEQALHGVGCFGIIPLAEHRFQIHFMVVDQDHRKTGLPKLLEQAIVERIQKAGGTKVYAEASNQERHLSLRHFYESCDYQLVSVVPDFYAQGDHKVWFVKDLAQ